MVDILPAVLPKNFSDLKQRLESLQGIAPVVQIDLVGTNILAGHEAIPLWEEFDFEIDIMLPQPEAEVRQCIDIGAARIVVHASAPTAHQALEILQETRGGDYAVEVGIALAAHDMLEVLKNFDRLYDYVQVMGIDRIGKQGEPPDPHHHEILLIKELRRAYPELLIQVDGAVAVHPRELVEAGANRLIVGSAIVNAEDPQAALKSLYNQINARS